MSEARVMTGAVADPINLKVIVWPLVSETASNPMLSVPAMWLKKPPTPPIFALCARFPFSGWASTASYCNKLTEGNTSVRCICILKFTKVWF